MKLPKRTSFQKLNDSILIRKSRVIYFNYLINHKIKTKPQGVVLKTNGIGYLIFSSQTLLPDEIFVPLEIIIP